MNMTFAIILILCLASMVASAQWKVDSVASGEPDTKLIQVLETEKSVLIYVTLQRDCTKTML